MFFVVSPASIEQEVANAWNDDVVEGNSPFQIFDHLLSGPRPHHGAAVVVAITDAVLGQEAAANRKTRRVAFDGRVHRIPRNLSRSKRSGASPLFSMSRVSMSRSCSEGLVSSCPDLQG